jgi:acylglycerol lipase
MYLTYMLPPSLHSTSRSIVKRLVANSVNGPKILISKKRLLTVAIPGFSHHRPRSTTASINQTKLDNPNTTKVSPSTAHRPVKTTKPTATMSEPTIEEGWFTLPDGNKLYTKTTTPAPSTPTKARLAFVHGFSDHIGFYDPFFRLLSQSGIAVYAFDQRGWGRSVLEKRHRGLTGNTDQVLDDITQFLATIPSDPSVPLFLMGHSMGGAEVLLYAAHAGPATRRIRGFLAESPFIALHPKSRPWKSTVVLGRLAGKLLPRFQMVNKLDLNLLSRDPEHKARVEADELCHDTGTLEGLAGMLDRAAMLEDGQVVISEGVGEGGKTRLWIGHGTADGICDFEATKRMFERVEAEDRELRAYEGWYHQLHVEVGEDKVKYARDVIHWILERSGPLDGAERSKL